MIYRSSMDGDANGVTVTTGNSANNNSGRSFDVVSLPGNSVGAYDNTYVRSNSTGIQCASDGTGAAVIGWTGTASASAATRIYFWYDTTPAATCSLMQFRSASSNQGNYNLKNDGYINVTGDGGVLIGTSSAALSTGTMYRLEMVMTKGTTTANGRIQAALYLGESTTALDSWDNTATNAGVDDFAALRFGTLTNTTAAGFFDDWAVEFGRDSFIGPAPTGTASVTQAREYYTAIDTTGSVGAVSVIQTGGTNATIEAPDDDNGIGQWLIEHPDGHTDTLKFDVIAAASTTTAVSTYVRPVAAGQGLVFQGGDNQNLEDWA